ncbi:hypothetical protein AB0K93_23140 [Streptomyces sp. NPDC052676]
MTVGGKSYCDLTDATGRRVAAQPPLARDAGPDGLEAPWLVFLTLLIA